MKHILVIGDGIADRPMDVLAGRTALMASRKPRIDALARVSEVGLVRTVPVGVAPGSDTAILSIFGYDPRKYYSGRSPLEAAGSGRPLPAGSLSMRCNLVALDGDGALEDRVMRSHSGGSIEGAQALRLVEDLQRDPEFSALMREAGMEIIASPTFRQIAVFARIPGDRITTTPPHDILGKAAGAYLPEGGNREMHVRLMRCALRALDAHPINAERKAAGKLPANGIWFWGEGEAIELPSFAARYGSTGGVISAVPLVKGIARLAGLDAPEVEGANGELETNYKGKVDAALEALRSADFAALHVEAPDECSHAGDVEGKLKAIEYLDDRLMRPLMEGLEAFDEYRVLLLSDHATPLSTRTHADDPVPFLLYDSRAEAPSRALAFDETQAEKGPFIQEGSSIMGRLFQMA